MLNAREFIGEQLFMLTENWGKLGSALPKAAIKELSRSTMTRVLGGAIGRNSNIETKSAVTEWGKFRVNVIDENSVIVLYKNKKTDAFVMFYSEIPSIASGFTIHRGTNKKIRIATSKGVSFSRTYSDRSAKQDFENFIATDVEDPQDWEIVIVKPDMDRLKKQSDRMLQKNGVVPLPGEPGYRKYIADLKNDMKEKFRSVKINIIANKDKINNINDYKKYAEKEIPKAINFQGVPMELRDISIRGKDESDWTPDQIEYMERGDTSIVDFLKSAEENGMVRDEAREVYGRKPRRVMLKIAMKGLNLEIVSMEITLNNGDTVTEKV